MITDREKNDARIWFVYGWNYIEKIKSEGKPKKFHKQQIIDRIANRSRKKNHFDQSYIAGVKAAIKYISLGHSLKKIEITENKLLVSHGPGRNWHGTRQYYKSLLQPRETLGKTEIQYVQKVLGTING